MSTTRVQEQRQAKSQKGREAYDEVGCSICGCHVSSSFRNGADGGRICNSCHCKTYRLKRKLAGQPTGRAAAANAARPKPLQRQRMQEPSSPQLTLPQAHLQAQAQTQMVHVPTPSPAAPEEPWTAATADAHASPSPPLEPCMASQSTQQVLPLGLHSTAALPELQRRVFLEVGGAGADVALTLACARRAQQATPECMHRTVLAVLPAVQLRLPDDPPGLTHSIACLVEAVRPTHELSEQGADSQDCGRALKGSGDPLLTPPALGEAEVSVRLTVFASAGAVACWHEAPPTPRLSLAFCPLTKAPIWSSGPGGFSLQFPHPFCPQVDMFAGVHRLVSTAGLAALSQPTISLLPMGAWDTTGAAAAAAVHAGTATSYPPAPAPLIPDALMPHMARQGDMAPMGGLAPPAGLHAHLDPGHHQHLDHLPFPDPDPHPFRSHHHYSHQHQHEAQSPARPLSPLQLSFGPMPSGPLLSGGMPSLPALSGFNL